MNHALLISHFLSTPWALMPEQLAVLSGIVARKLRDEAPSAATLADVRAAQEINAARQQAAAPRAGNGAIALIPVYGTIVQRAGMFDDVSGACSTQMVSSQLRNAMNDDTVGGIVMDFDTPGGSVYGVAELADEIRAARGVKPVYGLSNSLSASAGYWLMSQCEQTFCMPGGEVGSIGVYGAHENAAKYMEDLGLQITLVSAGKFKVEGNPYEPLSDEARAAMQLRIDQYYTAFTSAVAKGRSVPVSAVRDGMGQGRVLGAADAKAAGMIDDIDTLDGVVKRMTKALRAGPAAAKGNSSRAALRELDYLSST